MVQEHRGAADKWKVNVSTKITINGREYSSVDEMPPEVLAIYEKSMSMLADRDGNGIPDIMEGGNVKITGGANFKMVSAVSRKITVNGKNYNRFDDLPAEVQQKFREAGIAGQPGASDRPPAQTTRRQLQYPAAPQEGFSALTLLIAFLAALAVTGVLAWMIFHTR